MNRSSRMFVLIALVGLGLLVLAQSTALAQYRPMGGPIIRSFRPAIVPSARSYNSRPFGWNRNQGVWNARRGQTRVFFGDLNPYLVPGYPSMYVPNYNPGISNTPYTLNSIYNPFFDSYGLYP